MRRHAALGFAALALALAPDTHAQTAVFGVARDGSGFLYENVSIPVWADLTNAGGAALGSYTVRITFDPAIIYYNGFRPGTFADPVMRTDSVGYGVLRLAGISAAGAAGFTQLGHLIFYAYGTATTPIGIEVLEASAAGTFADLLPIVTTSPGVYCGALGRWGDLDSDGDANSRDALAILTKVVGLDPGVAFNMILGDTDGDARTDTRDALILLSYAVGLEITGQRVLTVAPGGCALQSVGQVTVVPDALDLVPGQRMALRVTARDNNGVPVVLNGLNWVLDQPHIGTVDAYEQEFVAREPGTATLRAALGPGIWAEVPVIVRERRGQWHVNGRVPRGAVAMGTAAYPFWTPQQAFPLLREGDTIRVAPGIVDYDPEFDDFAPTGFLLLGDTLPDGTRPTLRDAGTCCYVAYMYNYYYDAPPAGAPPAGVAGAARRRVEMRNLDIQGFDGLLYASGLSVLIMRNVRTEVRGYYGYGVDINSPTDTVDLEGVEFIADSGSSYGTAVTLEGGTFLRMVDVSVQHYGTGVYLYEGMDSIHIANSEFRGSQYDAVSIYPYDRPVLGLYIGNSRFINNYRGLAGFELVRATLANNVWDGHQDETIQLYAPYWTQVPAGASRRYTVTGDSIRRPMFGDWIQANDFDTLRIADVHVAVADGEYGYSSIAGRHVDIRRTVLDGVPYEGFDLYAETAVLDTVTVQGCVTCAYVSVTGVSLRPFASAGPMATIRGSTFRRLGVGIYMPSSTTAGPLQIMNSTLDSIALPVYGYLDSAVIDDSRLRFVTQQAVSAYGTGGRRTVVMRRNLITCQPNQSGTQYGVSLEGLPIQAEGNHIVECDYGFWAYNPNVNLFTASFLNDSVFQGTNTTGQRAIYLDSRWRPVLRGVRVRGGAYGFHIATSDTATVRIDSTAVSGTTTAGIYLQLFDGAGVIGERNNITNNLLDGVLNSGTGFRSLTLGRFVGNARWAINSSAAFDAHQNYWGPAGPGPGVAGDSSTAIVGDSLPVFTDPANVPQPAPPMAAAVAMGASSTLLSAERPVPLAPAVPTPVVARDARAIIEAARAEARRRLEEFRQRRPIRRHD